MQTANTNTQVATFAGMTGTSILSRTGAVTGVQICLGTMSAREIREAGRGLGLRGDKLTQYVNKALTEETAARAAHGAVALSALQSAGYVFDMATARKASAVIRFVKPPEPKSAKAKAIAALSGMTAEEKAEIAALLSAETK